MAFDATVKAWVNSKQGIPFGLKVAIDIKKSMKEVQDGKTRDIKNLLQEL